MSTRLRTASQITNSITPPESTESLSHGDNPYLSGIFGPIRDEITSDNLCVIGWLPDDLDGMFVRNGPNPMHAPSATYHAFDGHGMLHGVRIRDGQARYLNRYVQTTSWRQERKSGKHVGVGMHDGAWNTFKNILRGLRTGSAEFSNKANTSLVWHHGKLFALWEAGAPYEIEPADLRTIAAETFGGSLKHGFTAHPKVDSVTGEMMFFGYSPIHRGIQYGILDRTGHVTHSTEVKLKRPVMMHDCAITKRHTVFLDVPMVANVFRPLIGKPTYQYRPQYGARFGILPRHADGSAIRWFEVDPCFLFHVLNAWEKDDWLTVYGCRFSNAPSVLRSKRLNKGEFSLDAVMYRWRFNLTTGEVNEGPIDDNHVEFPRVDDKLVGDQTRFGYATSFFGDKESALFKYDLQGNTTRRHDLDAGQIAGEGLFVARRNQESEDDGYLLTLVHDEIEQRSELFVLDCRRFDQTPVARIQMPQRVPAGFHGVWLDGHDV